MAADRFDHLFIAPSDFDRALAFYRDTLGWRVAAQWGGGGAPRGAQLDGGGTRLVIAEPHDAADRSWTHGIHGTRPTLHLAVDDIDARYSALADRTRVVVPPEDTHWGTRWFVVRDPDDNLVAFFQARLG
jgi:uncharacterized glyoxalase superfamily protein PhnB